MAHRTTGEVNNFTPRAANTIATPEQGFSHVGEYHTSMVHAFIMVKTAAGESERLVDAIRGLGQIAEAHIVAGDWDIIVELDTDEVYDVLKTSSSEVQGLKGVDNTKTYISLDD
jgi:DNA-binding Lrp family transcriptional regulator